MAVTVKCPTCSRETGAACITLVRTPANTVQWVNREPHPQRAERARG